ncbi:MAG TPA: helix-hairpin-helix domain-containing protein [Thermomicrobiales bacterium]|nr:helix-hairpin-helix domain-containing protein [Thermomicrobiales bacterium]
MSWGTTVRPYLAGLVVALAIAGVVLLARGRGQHETLITIEPPPDDPQAQSITVFVGGAVASPGVYTLPPGARVDVALAAAGGLSADADPDAVNRALKLRDEAQVIVPRKGAPRPAATAPSGGVSGPGGATPSRAAPTAPAGAAATGPLDVNTAPAADLEHLPGVGPHLAQAIVDYRDAHGPFAGAADLAQVKGISDKMVADWLDAGLIAFGP